MSRKKEKNVEYSFGVTTNMKEWMLLVTAKGTDVRLTPEEYIEALEVWIKNLRNNTHDVLGYTTVDPAGLDILTEEGEIH